MPSQSPRSEREEERRLNVRTLTIASAASASAALVTSQLWIAGTWIAAALTPVLVALIAEVLTRPTERISRALTSDRTAVFPVGDDPEPRTSRAPERDPDAPRPRSLPVDPDPRRPRGTEPGDAAPVRVYRSGAAGPRGGRRKRKVAIGMVAATAGTAFVIAALLITVPELIAGQSIGQAERGTTFLGGTPRAKKQTRNDKQSTEQTPTETTPAETETTTTPADEQPTETTPPPTETAPPTTTPAPEAAPPQTTTPAP
jgi:hypothetical protein